MLLTGILLALQDAAPAVAAPRARGWDDFPVFVWREKYAGKPPPEELIEPFGGVILMREEDSSWARERGLSYLVWNVAGRDALHLDADEAWNARVEQWIETHDEKLLVREPCLGEPETVARLFTTLDATLAKHGEAPGLGFVLGDEVGLTPNGDPFDLCRCTLCEAKWREYARENGQPERAPLTDEVRLALLDGDTSTLGAWLARRRFERDRFSKLLLALAERCRDHAPFQVKSSRRFPVGVLGLGAQTAFGALDVATVFPALDFCESYPQADARETLYSFDGRARPASEPPIRSLATIFLAHETPESAAWRVWEHWLRGGSGLVLWSDALLAREPRKRERIAEAVHCIRVLGRRFPDLLAPSLGVTLLQDDDSVALSWLRDALLDGPTWPRRRSSFQVRGGTRETSVKAWLARLEDLGCLPGSVPIARLGKLRGWLDVLIAPQLSVLGSEDVEVLQSCVGTRGVLVVDGSLGSTDRGGRARDGDLAGLLRARAPERVLDAARMPRELEAALRIVQEPAPIFRGEAATIPWLVSRRPIEWKPCLDPPLEYLLTLLPRTDRPEHEGCFPAGLELQVEPPPECAWERLHPPAGELLRPGDAAVFLVRWPVEQPK